MKPISKKTIAADFSRHAGVLLLAATLAFTAAMATAKDNSNNNANNKNNKKSKTEGYVVTNLVSDMAGVAQYQDITLINPWGISSSANGPFWISVNGAGSIAVYSVTNDTNGSAVVTPQGLTVFVPGNEPTGQAFDENASFNGDSFIFAGEDGTISGWRSDLGTTAETLTLRSNAVYKGVAVINIKGNITETNTSNGHGNHSKNHGKGDATLLLAANFSEGTVDVYDTNMVLVAQLTDSNAPAGYAPFNVQKIGGNVFITFAKQDDAMHDDVSGAGNGFIDVLDLKKGELRRFATGTSVGGTISDMNSPWGLALAPKSFTGHGDELLVGNFGSGTIMAFSTNGKFQGLLEDTNSEPIVIDGLWGLSFGNDGNAGVSDTLYFTAGPNGETNGVFGSISPANTSNNNKHNHNQ